LLGNLIIGDQASCMLLAINATDGTKVWNTTLDTHPSCKLTQTPTLYDGYIYEGTSSNEESTASYITDYVCCTFQGSVSKIEATTGNIVWTSKVLPDNNGQPDGYSG
jgi:polyvinyl alcohol dehydrogenase (cytochrome)